MNRFLLIDGSNLLFQMFYGMPARIVNSQGKAIQGTLGFVGALLKIIRKVDPNYIFVIFDGEHENSRTLIDSSYKANRPDYNKMSEEENPFSQIHDIYAALDFMGIKHFETTDCESDDLIACYALEYAKNTEIIISSLDSDFFQLISDKISILRYHGEKTVICTPEYIKEKFGITPKQYTDFKALVGDKSDNIKGAEKIGLKTASALLNEFGNLKSIIENAHKIKKPSIRDSVIKNTDKLKINYQIIKLGSYDLKPFSLNELKYSYNGIITNDVLINIGLK